MGRVAEYFNGLSNRAVWVWIGAVVVVCAGIGVGTYYGVEAAITRSAHKGFSFSTNFKGDDVEGFTANYDVDDNGNTFRVWDSAGYQAMGKDDYYSTTWNTKITHYEPGLTLYTDNAFILNTSYGDTYLSFSYLEAIDVKFTGTNSAYSMTDFDYLQVEWSKDKITTSSITAISNPKSTTQPVGFLPITVETLTVSPKTNLLDTTDPINALATIANDTWTNILDGDWSQFVTQNNFFQDAFGITGQIPTYELPAWDSLVQPVID